MKVVNFFGGPGAGKSTAASGLFHEMKRHWINAEYVQEFAKELVWSDSSHMLSQQNRIFAEQEHRLNRLRTKVDVAVSDSPLILSSFYAPTSYPDSFHKYVFDFFGMYENINILVRRSHEYALEGRLQKQKDADHIADEMERFLIQNGIPFHSITASDAAPQRLLRWLVERMGVPIPDGVPLSTDSADDPSLGVWMHDMPAQRGWRSGDPVRLADLAGVLTVGATPSTTPPVTKTRAGGRAGSRPRRGPPPQGTP